MAKRTQRTTQPAGGGPNSSGARLRSYLERIERLEEEKKTIADDIKDVFGEAKGEGYDAKAMKKILAERKADKDALMEFEAIVDTYRAALGMLPPMEDEDISEGGEDDGEGESLV